MERIHLGSLAAWKHDVASPRGAVLVIHGLSEHSGRHLNTVEFLNSQGLNVLRFDLRGAGKSGGRRQYVDQFSDYVDDANSAFNALARDNPKLPLVVFGHSLGGAIAIRLAALRSASFRALVLSAPAYRLGSGMSPIVITVGKALSRLFPTFAMPKTAPPTGVSRDPAVVEAFLKDPLSTHSNTLRQGTEILKALPDTLEQVDQFKCPVFMVHGTHDTIINFEGSFEIFKRIPTPYKCFHVVPGGFHEAHNDYGKEAYFADLGRWLNHRLA
ncbi:MAG: lysophospholipase [Bdellovibrionales bacterium]|nr:lysophospholipase [Bdellovibrionales bacterium]